jgi:murein DD-endopeptidase MepM/ murein hydrolase activator NlpD
LTSASRAGGLLLSVAAAVLLTLLAPAGAFADGRVLPSSTLPELGGLALDLLQPGVTPQLAPSRTVTWTYQALPGDSLDTVAHFFDVDAATLARNNRLKAGSSLEPGQSLAGRVTLPASSPLPAGLPVTALMMQPWPPVQGQTLTVWLRLQSDVTPALSFEGTTVTSEQQGLVAWALVPVPPLTPPGAHTLTVTVGNRLAVVTVPVAPGLFEFQEIPASASDPILSNQPQVQSETARIDALTAPSSAGQWSTSARFAFPFPTDYPHTSPFGSRRTYGDSAALTTHSGEDIAPPAGTVVLAPAAGRVVLAETLFVRGNAVVLDHGRGVFTGYWHMQKLLVKAGDVVAVGQPLGEVGTTGLSTGPHLHWEMRVHGVAVDPLQWLTGLPQTAGG